jgi:hypothetical protein
MNQSQTYWALETVLLWGLPVRTWMVQATAASVRSCLASAARRV